MGKTSSQSKNKYNRKAYDRISVMVPKGKKDIYTEIAKSKGLSLNGYINKLLNENLEEINQSDDPDPMEQQPE